MAGGTKNLKIQPFIILWFPVPVMRFEGFRIGEISFLDPANLAEIDFKVSPCRAWRSFPVLDGIL